MNFTKFQSLLSIQQLALLKKEYILLKKEEKILDKEYERLCNEVLLNETSIEQNIIDLNILVAKSTVLLEKMETLRILLSNILLQVSN